MTALSSECPTCNGLGKISDAPDGERIYCEACIYGVRLALESVRRKMDAEGEWLRGHEFEAHQIELEAVAEHVTYLIAEYDRLSALLDTLKQNEANRVPARLSDES